MIPVEQLEAELATTRMDVLDLQEEIDRQKEINSELAKMHSREYGNLQIANKNAQLMHLQAINAELVEALQFCKNVLSGYPLRSSEAKAWQVAYDTLAKARGES